MFTTIDKSEDVWCTLDAGEDGKWFVSCDDDTSHQFTTGALVCTRGKYEGYKLDEISDQPYLKWVQEANKDDGFLQEVCELRIQELK